MPMIARKLLLAGLAVGGLVMAGAASAQADDSERLAEAKRILDAAPLIDGHNDLAWQYRERVNNHLDEIDIGEKQLDRDPPLHTDIPRLREGGVGAQIWSVYIPVEMTGGEAVRAVFEQIDVVHRLIDRYEALQPALTADDVERIHEHGGIASLIGMEGGHSIGASLGVLREAYRAGVRAMTITHWQNHEWADSATDAPEHDGLTPFGEEVIREMNRLGMMIDLSHVSADTMRDVFDISLAPVIYTHSSARAVTPHTRNVPDDILPLVKDNGGVVMVTFVPSFSSEQVRQWRAEQSAAEARYDSLYIGQPDKAEAALEEWEENNPRPKATIADVADHIDYLRDNLGIEHIGIGGDFDGISTTPEGLEDASTYPALFAELLERGYTEAELTKIAGQNLLRVLRETEKVSERLRAERAPSDAQIEELDGEQADTDEDQDESDD